MDKTNKTAVERSTIFSILICILVMISGWVASYPLPLLIGPANQSWLNNGQVLFKFETGMGYDNCSIHI
jgi:hypothetical protein